MSGAKKVDRLYVDKKDIDNFNRLKEKDSPFAASQNKDVFLAAMVTGYSNGSRIELKKKQGYVREEYLSDDDLALIRAIAVSEEGSLNVLLNKQQVFSIAEEYAAGGIVLLKTKVFSEDYGSYAKKLESELLRKCERWAEKQPKKPMEIEEFSKLSVVDLIESGETERIEFKSSLIWDYDKGQKNKLMGMIVAKVVACFMNSNGGIVLIGVANNKEILGLEKDLSQLERATLDEFELHFTNVLNKYVGKVFRPYVDVRFERVDNKDAALIQVKKSPHPVYLKYKGKTEFYIRAGNSCQPLNISEATLYIKDHWPDL